MAPELYRKKGIVEKLIADIPDQSGTYDTPIGQIRVDARGIHPSNIAQEIILEGNALKGRKGSATEEGKRVIQLSGRHGTGSAHLSRDERLDVKLHSPITARDQSNYTKGPIGATYPDYPERSWGIRRDLPADRNSDRRKEIYRKI